MYRKADVIVTEAAYRRQFSAVFNYATLPFYWASYEPAPGKTDHARIEAMARWCQAQGIVPKGHPLAWNYADPVWLPSGMDEIRALQMKRIDDCAQRFQGLIDVWDVVNEATHFERDEFRRQAPKLTSLWEKTGRVEFVRECFQHARAASSKARLVINDYRTDPAYASLLTQLAQGQRPFDVIGIQSHMHGGVWSNAQVWEVCERFARFGVPLRFSETTILGGGERPKRGQPWPSTPEGEKRQAQEVGRFYTMLFSHPAVAAITWWDFSDRHAWQDAPAGFLRSDMSPKPAYDRLYHLIRERWWTHAGGTTGLSGEARFRAFLGQHRITVTTSTAKKEATLVVEKGGVARITVRLP